MLPTRRYGAGDDWKTPRESGTEAPRARVLYRFYAPSLELQIAY